MRKKSSTSYLNKIDYKNPVHMVALFGAVALMSIVLVAILKVLFIIAIFGAGGYLFYWVWKSKGKGDKENENNRPD